MSPGTRTDEGRYQRSEPDAGDGGRADRGAPRRSAGEPHCLAGRTGTWARLRPPARSVLGERGRCLEPQGRLGLQPLGPGAEVGCALLSGAPTELQPPRRPRAGPEARPTGPPGTARTRRSSGRTTRARTVTNGTTRANRRGVPRPQTAWIATSPDHTTQSTTAAVASALDLDLGLVEFDRQGSAAHRGQGRGDRRADLGPVASCEHRGQRHATRHTQSGGLHHRLHDHLVPDRQDVAHTGAPGMPRASRTCAAEITSSSHVEMTRSGAGRPSTAARTSAAESPVSERSTAQGPTDWRSGRTMQGCRAGPERACTSVHFSAEACCERFRGLAYCSAQ
ncbi:hypothetical protein SUDANB51_08009 [Streptomyces sp. enrichment culture]